MLPLAPHGATFSKKGANLPNNMPCPQMNKDEQNSNRNRDISYDENCTACPVLNSGDLNGQKYASDSKKITPFGDPNHNIGTSYVGATCQVARKKPRKYRVFDDLLLAENCHVLRSGQGVPPPPPYTYCMYTVTQKGGKIRASSEHLRTYCAPSSARALAACRKLSAPQRSGGQGFGARVWQDVNETKYQLGLAFGF